LEEGDDEELYEPNYNSSKRIETKYKEETEYVPNYQEDEYNPTDLEILKDKFDDMLAEKESQKYRKENIEEKSFKKYREELREIFFDDCEGTEPIADVIANKSSQLLFRFKNVKGWIDLRVNFFGII
jgi:hypothetical protein